MTLTTDDSKWSWSRGMTLLVRNPGEQGHQRYPFLYVIRVDKDTEYVSSSPWSLEDKDTKHVPSSPWSLEDKVNN